MTPFAQLEKSAAPQFLRRAHRFVNDGVWGTAARKTQGHTDGFKGGVNRLSRLFHNPATGKSTKLSKGLTGYGLAGVGAGAMGYDLPGSELAWNATMPGLGALFAAPGVITAARMAGAKNQERLANDVREGGRNAASDLISLTQADHRFATQPGAYGQYMQQHAPGIDSLVKQYRSGQPEEMSNWKSLGTSLTDPQTFINNKVDHQIHNLLNSSGGALGLSKSSSMQKEAIAPLLGKAFKGVTSAMPWVFGAGGVAAAGHAALRDKPYDAAQAQARGYAAGQVKLQDALQNMSPFQRMGLRFDPSLLAQKMESVAPGTIKHWEGSTGQRHQPGWISRTMSNFRKGGEQNYYEYDANGQRHYL